MRPFEIKVGIKLLEQIKIMSESSVSNECLYQIKVPAVSNFTVKHLSSHNEKKWDIQWYWLVYKDSYKGVLQASYRFYR